MNENVGGGPSKGGSARFGLTLLLSLFLLPALLFSREEKGSPVSSFPRTPIRFSDVTKAAGIEFKFDTDLRRGRNLATMGGGVAMGDFDSDGWPDLFFTGSVSNGNKPDAGPC